MDRSKDAFAKMNTPLRASRFLSGKGKAIMPKLDLYKSEVDHLRLKIATDHGYLSWEEYADMRQMENEKFFEEELGCQPDHGEKCHCNNCYAEEHMKWIKSMKAKEKIA